MSVEEKTKAKNSYEVMLEALEASRSILTDTEYEHIKKVIISNMNNVLSPYNSKDSLS